MSVTLLYKSYSRVAYSPTYCDMCSIMPRYIRKSLLYSTYSSTGSNPECSQHQHPEEFSSSIS